MTNIIVKEVNFQNVGMIACKTEDGKIRVGIRSICDGLGIDYLGQVQRINRDDILPKGVCKIHMPTSGGIQEVNMLDIEYLPFFLTGIKSSMVRPEIAPKIVEFKLKAKDVLAEAFLSKTYNNPNRSSYRDLASLMREWRLWAKEMKMPANQAMKLLIEFLNKKGEPVPKEMAYSSVLYSRKIDQSVVEFLEESEFDNEFIQSLVLYKMYCDYCHDKGINPLSHRSFGLALKELNCPKKRSMGLSMWIPTKGRQVRI